MRVEDVYRPLVVTCEPTTRLSEIARRMTEEGTGSVAVVSDHLLGLITQGDVVRAIAEGADPATTPVTDYAATYLVTALLDEDTDIVARRMVEEDIRHVPVVGRAGELVGTVSMLDLFALSALT